jgi:hypothetical protein
METTFIRSTQHSSYEPLYRQRPSSVAEAGYTYYITLLFFPIMLNCYTIYLTSTRDPMVVMYEFN